MILGAAFAGLLGASVSGADCRSDEVHLRGDWGAARFSVELADEAAERAEGLMHREHLPKSAGMLFVYEAPVEATFWMRNTLIALDMIFIDDRGRVINIKNSAQPLDETFISSEGKVLAVLEVNGGLSKALGINVGSEVRHPAFDQARALWACAE